MKEILKAGKRIFEVEGPLTSEQRSQVMQKLQSILKVSPATCPASAVQNSTHPVTISATGGVPPYTYSMLMDGIVKITSGPIPSTTWTGSATFSEAIGPHTIIGQVEDSCASKQKATDICPAFSITAPVITGSISCTSTPSGALVSLDGVNQGVVAPVTLTNITQGSHTATFTLSGYNSCSSSVTVTAGQTATASCTLTQIVTTGSISCSSTPTGAYVALDGVNQGVVTPATLTNVTPGSHTATYTLSGYNPCSASVTVIAGQTAAASCILIPTAATICTWISSSGGVSSVTIPKIFNLVDAYIGIINLGFTPTNQQIFGSVDYYLGFIASGNSKTGCSF